MKELQQLPKGFEQYQYIVDEFMKVPGVEKVGAINKDGDLSLYITNNKTGKALKVWNFPLRCVIDMSIDDSMVNESDYDILDLEDPSLMILAGVKKAELFFK